MSHSLSPTFYRLGRWLTRQTLGRFFTLQVEGLEHLPAPGPAIICPKHQRWEDIPVIGMALPAPPHFIAKVELFQQPVVRELLGAWGGVPVDRQNPRATLSSFRRLLPLLTKGAFIVVFPEGTYFKGRVGPGNGGPRPSSRMTNVSWPGTPPSPGTGWPGSWPRTALPWI
jgi:1-acyl-sn-glycerol-3-phosphate acyltransferase